MFDPSILIEPFDDPSLFTVMKWYVSLFVLSITVSKIMERMGLKRDISGYSVGDLFIAAVIIAPPVEEILFRFVPVYFWNTPVAIVGFTIIWGLMHGYAVVAVLCMAPIFIKLVAGGYLIEAILLHAFHNLIAVTSTYIVRKRKN